MTPTEELVLEVLTARVRLGEQLWTYSTRFTPAVRSLEEAGWVGWKSGIVENTILVWPTPQLLEDASWFSPTYVPPILKNP